MILKFLKILRIKKRKHVLKFTFSGRVRKMCVFFWDLMSARSIPKVSLVQFLMYNNPSPSALWEDWGDLGLAS